MKKTDFAIWEFESEIPNGIVTSGIAPKAGPDIREVFGAGKTGPYDSAVTKNGVPESRFLLA